MSFVHILVLALASQMSLTVHGAIYTWGHNDNTIYAVNPAEGSLKWKFKAGAFPRFYPVDTDGACYFGSEDGYLYAVNASDGSLKWKITTGASPIVLLVADGVVYYVSYADGYLYAVNAAEGTQIWKSKTEGGSSLSSSAVVADGVIYFGYDYYVYAVNAADGSLKWKFNTGHDLAPTPAVGADGVIYVGSRGAKGYGGVIHGVNAADGSLKWELAVDVDSSLVVADGVIVVSGQGDLHGVSAADHALKWNLSAKYGMERESNPEAGADGIVYIVSSENKGVKSCQQYGSCQGYLHAVNAADGSLKWKFDVGTKPGAGSGWFFTTPVVSDGVVYVTRSRQYASSNSLLAVNEADGSLKWVFETPGDHVVEATLV